MSSEESNFLEQEYSPESTEQEKSFTPYTYAPKRKKQGAWLLWISALASVVVVIVAFFLLRDSNLTTNVPTQGGIFVEGIVGTPRFINPVLAETNSDRDTTALVFAGLMRPSEDGLQPELAEGYSISEDGLEYVFSLKKDLTFHDGSPLTADDVIFTIASIQNPAIKSPLFANWEGIKVEKRDDHQIAFILSEPYAPFLENTTIGILPEEAWRNTTPDEFPFSQLNTRPLGAGPFKIESITRDEADIPRGYTLARFTEYTQGAPYLKEIQLQFYRSETEALQAYHDGTIDAFARPGSQNIGSVSEEQLLTTPLPRIFGVFFNKNRATVFTREEVREALALSIDKQELITRALHGYGHTISSPIPLGVFDSATSSEEHYENRSQEAIELLENKGWEKSEDGIWVLETDDETLVLTFTLSTTNIPELAAAADYIVERWESIGVVVELETLDSVALSQEKIRPRSYDALLFGEIVGRELDLYAFWHSSQRNDPGLNIALYTNITADAELTKARQKTGYADRLTALEAFEEEVTSDHPAIFLFSPDALYLKAEHVHNVNIEGIADPTERFRDVHTWYANTRRVWNGLSK